MKTASFFVILTRGAASFVFAQKTQMGGASTDEAKNFAVKRTTGIVDPTARKVYEDVTANTALANFRCVSSADKNYICVNRGELFFFVFLRALAENI